MVHTALPSQPSPVQPPPDAVQPGPVGALATMTLPWGQPIPATSVSAAAACGCAAATPGCAAAVPGSAAAACGCGTTVVLCNRAVRTGVAPGPFPPAPGCRPVELVP